MVSSPLITSRQNPQVKEAVRLREGSERRRQKRFIVDGAREICRALESGIRPVKAFICDELCQSAESLQAKAVCQKQAAELLPVSPEVFAKLAFGDRNDGVIVIAETPRGSLSNLELPAAPLVVVLEGLEKPGNVGAILRSADAAGVDAVVFTGGIGENSAVLRRKSCEGLHHLGIELDPERNENGQGDRLLSSDTSPVKVLALAANEEIVVARRAYRALTASA